MRDAESGRRHADKLVRLWRKDGGETWVLAHFEVQGDPDSEFESRMYRYDYRIADRYGRLVISFAVLTDDNAAWRPEAYEVGAWGFRLRMEFPVVKLLD